MQAGWDDGLLLPSTTPPAMADDNGRRAPVLAQPVPAQTHSWVVRFLICAVATVAGLALCTTVTPPMHHSMYQTLGKNDPSTLHPPGVHLLPMPRPFSRSIHVKTALDVDKVTDIKVGLASFQAPF